MLTRSGLWLNAISSLLLGGGLGAVLLLLSVPLWLVVAVFIVLLAVIWWQLPYIRACLLGEIPKKLDNRPNGYWWWRAGLLMVLVVAGVVAQSVWWTQQPRYSTVASQYDDNFEEKKDANGNPIEIITRHSLPTAYSLKKTLWELGWVPLPKLLTIPAGTFQMGSEKYDNEKPVHPVTFANAFYMSQTEVTFEQYDYYVWRMQKADVEGVDYPHDEGWGRGQRPVINVSWDDAQGYVNWLSQYQQQPCRLPSEAEWEYAARAGTTTVYSWGDDIGNNRANCDGCGSEWDNKQTAPVGSFAPNSWGLNDMHGNVWEWVQDRWHDNYNDAPADGYAWSGDGGRVLRGGSWHYAPDILRAAVRSGNFPVSRNFNLGFRVVCSSPSVR